MWCCALTKDEQVYLLGNQSLGGRCIETAKERDEPLIQPIFPSYRLLVCTITFLGVCCAFGSQALVGASLLLMIRQDDDVSVDVTGPSSSTQALSEFSNSIESTLSNRLYDEDEWHYDWDKSTKGWLASCYFAGYYLMQIPTGWLTGRCGGYRLILASGAVNVLCQALSVWVPRYGPHAFAALLFVSGLANACSFPALFAVAAKWCPPNESSRLMAFVASGVSIGNAVVFCISAATSRIQLIGGWPFNFLSMVGMQLVFLMLWAVLVTNSPGHNKFVKLSEANYIMRNVTAKADQWKRPPWRKMLTYPPVYAIAASLYGADFLLYAMITVFPEYFVAVRHMSKTMTSLLSGLPWLLCPLTSYLVSQIVDILREKHIVTTITLRRIADVIAKPVAGLFLLISSLLPDDHVTSSSVLYALSGALLVAFQGCSWTANMADMAPNYVGEVFVIAQLFSMTGPFMAPPIFAALTPNNSAEEWQVCFGITFAILVATTLIYVVFASTQQADWTETDTQADCNETATQADWNETDTNADWNEPATQADWNETATQADWNETDTQADWNETATKADCNETDTQADCIETDTKADWNETNTQADK